MPCNFPSEWIEEGNITKPGRPASGVPFGDHSEKKKKKKKKRKRVDNEDLNPPQKKQSGADDETTRRPLFEVLNPYVKGETVPDGGGGGSGGGGGDVGEVAGAEEEPLTTSAGSILTVPHPIYLFGAGNSSMVTEDNEGDQEDEDEEDATSLLTGPTTTSIARLILFAKQNPRYQRPLVK